MWIVLGVGGALAAGVGTAWVGAAVWLDRRGARRPSGRFDAVVVAGCPVGADGRATPALERRVALGVALLREVDAPVLVLTGGVTGGPISEAACAAAVARRLGVAEAAIVLEEQSTDTLGNAAFARALLDADRVVIATDRYHAFRCERVFARHFAEVHVVGATPPPRARARHALREVFSVLSHGARGHLAPRSAPRRGGPGARPGLRGGAAGGVAELVDARDSKS